jgi:LIVCS family branched-chain amino acid:cation transporter
MKRYATHFIYGFAIFSMFFGSGNLVFPLQIGQNSGNYWFLGFLGLFITGILLPFLGLFVIKLHRGSYNAFFSEAGVAAGIMLPLFTLSLLGSFGVVPRCITVAYGGIEYIYPGLPLSVFSLLFCIICFITCIKENFMITVLGKWMTPLLLVSLTLLIFLGITNAPPLSDNLLTRTIAFQTGFLTGYQTMDLFAAFFFSALIFNQIQAKLKSTNDKEILKAALKPSLIGCFLLSLIYLGFVFLGAHYKSITTDISPELILPTIASHLMGEQAVVLIGFIVLFSCLTTAVALNSIYAHYLCGLFNFKKDKFLLVLLGTTSLSFIISLMDFRGIAAILGPLLEVTYPSIILLTLLSIFLRGHKKIKFFMFYGMLVVTILWMFF